MIISYADNLIFIIMIALVKVRYLAVVDGIQELFPDRLFHVYRIQQFVKRTKIPGVSDFRETF